MFHTSECKERFFHVLNKLLYKCTCITCIILRRIALIFTFGLTETFAVKRSNLLIDSTVLKIWISILIVVVTKNIFSRYHSRYWRAQVLLKFTVEVIRSGRS